MKIESDFTQDILDVRFDALEHPTLSNGAKVLFVYLLDLSLRRATNDMPGVVTISQTQLAERLKSSRSRVFAWKCELVQTGFVWTSHKLMPNTWPIERFHISALAPRGRDVEKMTSEGCWGNGKRRGPLCIENDTGDFTPQNTQTVDKGPEGCQKRHLSGVENDTGQVSEMTPGRYQKRHRAGVENESPKEGLRPEGKPSIGGGGSPAPFRSKVLKEIEHVKQQIETTRAIGKRVTRIHPAVLSKIKELEAEIAKNPDRKAELEAEIDDRKTNPIYRGTFLSPDSTRQVKALETRLAQLDAQLKVAI